MRPISLMIASLLGLCACAESAGPATTVDAAPAQCTLGAVTLGVEAEGSRFAPLHDGDTLEIVLGFQGLRMLRVSARVEGEPPQSVDLISYLEVEGGDVSVSQRNRDEPLSAQSDGTGLIEGYLLFLHDAPPEQLVGHTASFDLIVRDGECSSTASVELLLRDDDACVDFDVVVADAGAADPSVTQGATACE